MREVARLRRAAATLHAAADLLERATGGEDVALPPLRVAVHATSWRPALDFTVHGARPDPEVVAGLLIATTMHLPDGSEVHADVAVDDGSGTALNDPDDDPGDDLEYDLEERWAEVADLIASAAEGGPATPELYGWFRARSTFKRLTRTLAVEVGGDALLAALAVVGAGTTVGALADGWDGDLPALQEAVAALDPAPEPAEASRGPVGTVGPQDSAR